MTLRSRVRRFESCRGRSIWWCAWGHEPRFRTASAGTVELVDTKVFATGAVVHAHRPTTAR